ncbi:MAG: hypothetical protein ACRDDY_15265 [Clostridium sp.]|uniref:hypothetical protein n=1 Tax=Clostridium sp. TaxID=1506 RepID=UPI003EE72AE6
MKRYRKIMSVIIIAVCACVIDVVISYAQGTREQYEEYVDKGMVTVNNYREYIKLSPKKMEGLTGYIVYLNEDDDLNKSMGYLQKLAQNGYNIYIIKNNTYSNTIKMKIGKNIIKRDKDNVNWIVNNKSNDGEYIRELLEWTNDEGYRAGEISGYINSLKDLTKNKDLDDISNELHRIRNKI